MMDGMDLDMDMDMDMDMDVAKKERSGWTDPDLEAGDLVAFRYFNKELLTVALLCRNASGELMLTERVEPELSDRFGYPEEVAMFLESAGISGLSYLGDGYELRRIVALGFAPSYEFFDGTGLLRPFDFVGTYGGDAGRLSPWEELPLRKGAS